jgi:hypothetical protein
MVVPVGFDGVDLAHWANIEGQMGVESNIHTGVERRAFAKV